MAGTMLITGGGRGIGAATARLAAARGYAVAVNYVKDDRAANALVSELWASGGAALAIRADVSREKEVERLFHEAVRELGPLSVLVNSAGIVDRRARVDEIDEARLQRMMAINVVGSFLCAAEAVRRMSTRHGGRGGNIVNLSSAASKHGSPGEYVDYAASKAAIDVFTIGLAREVAAEAIRVNAVRPGIIDTEIHAGSGDPARAHRLAPELPLRRPGTARGGERYSLAGLRRSVILHRHDRRRRRGPLTAGRGARDRDRGCGRSARLSGYPEPSVAVTRMADGFRVGGAGIYSDGS